MKYCSQCGSEVNLSIPDGDDRHRHVCDDCDTIHYSNPKIIAGCVPVFEDKILLCKRAIEPRYGKWTLPAGFMENLESVEEGAIRETWEEARAEVTIDSLYTVFSLPEISQVYMLFRGHLKEPVFASGPESLDVGLFSEDEIPWDELAFPVVKKTLKHFFSDRDKGGDYPLRSEALYWPHRPKPKEDGSTS